MSSHSKGDTRCLVIAVYFGPLPSYFGLFCRSVEYNPKIDFLMVTDQDVEDAPSNLKVKRMTLQEFRLAAATAADVDVSIPRPYKVCDFRPAFGTIFAADISGYTHWGHCDLDVIFGDILGGIPEVAFTSYPKILIRGNFALYRNTAEANSWYKTVLPDLDYRRVFSTPNPFHFDESAGILRILEARGVPIWNEDCIFNIDWKHYRMRAIGSSRGYHTYVWRNGRIFEYSTDHRLDREPREAILIHLMKRPMKAPDFDVRRVTEYLIGPEGFSLPGETLKNQSTLSLVRSASQHRLRGVRRRLAKRGDLRPLA